MSLKIMFTESTIAGYVRTIRSCPREIIANRQLLFTVAMYATAGLPITWDQGSSSVIPSLPGFQAAFGITSAANPTQVTNFISFVYIGAGVGAGFSFFINDRIGRLWSFRLYMAIWIIGQMLATFSYGHTGVLYTARIVSGLGIGPLTVIGPVAIVEVAPTEIRGLLSVWFSVVMLLSLTVSIFVVLGVYLHVASSYLQYQIVFFVPTIAVALIVMGSFYLSESPRWLFLVNKQEQGVETLVKLRGLPATHPRVASEIEDIQRQIDGQWKFQKSSLQPGFIELCKETFLVPSNLRRVQQTFISYALAQLSGANSVTSYLVPILSLMGLGGGTDRSLFLSGMYSMAKFFFTLIASFCFIDVLGRRKSFFTGVTLQMVSDIYIGVYIKYRQSGLVTTSASEAAVGAIFIHGFGFAVGLLILPYVFGAEIWPNHIRSFGAAISQCFHWLFFFGINRATPSLLANTNNWGAFIFFAAWCFVSIVYAYFVIPETAREGLEDFDAIFEQPLWRAYRGTKRNNTTCIEAFEVSDAHDHMSRSGSDLTKKNNHFADDGVEI
ncbi:uncharacterized protein N7446_002550 [Penicillium canescens]|uniref:Major facilitator superfamily (MFS) profile domain-containing protein n=1 Tax=Penicillium canescens TaxID=5083 RepID=A0AAD6IF90_PENCN|nr:uncharacterized protein N7446_002550 [Penicillium canescens]KAJ6044357.1 hypothetical protein N7460_005712 [Penicillium canescens]KAJ6055825.1 hypothetical protein N7444_004923 [Penicillium canescens]KAJ6074773.1 hypothetical protein N7446_002550 [Penicillium canescens]